MSETVNDALELGIGTALRDARVARNLSLAEVSALLRIRESHLEAIELEDFEQLPGNVYAIGFIRTYAQYLELNEGDLIMRFKAASVDPGIADMRICESYNLARVRWVGNDFLVTGHRSIKNHLSTRLTSRSESTTTEYTAIF